MRTWPAMPGVPAAGHITARGGYWHPGRAEGCAKCEPNPVVVHAADHAWRPENCPACRSQRGTR